MINFYHEGIRLSYHAAAIAIVFLLFLGGQVKQWSWKKRSLRMWRDVNKQMGTRKRKTD